MKTLIVTVGICLLCFSSLNAKDATGTLSQLMSTIWKEEDPANVEKVPVNEYCCRFSKKKQFFFQIKGGKVIKNIFKTSRPFYLSNNIEKYFDENKVGNQSDGKYIITQYRNIILNEEDGEILRKSLYDQVSGRKLTAKEKRQLKKIRKEHQSEAEIVSFVYRIISLTKDELILERVSPMNMIGDKIVRYTSYSDNIAH